MGENGAYSEEMPVYEDDDLDHWDKFKLASGRQISLFPFTKNAIINLYDAMSNHKTPRYILRDIIEPAVNEVLYSISTFPKFCLGWRSSLPESIENRIGNIVQSIKIPQEQKSDYRKRLVTFMSFWTDKTLDVTSNGRIAGINTKIFFELDFSDFVGKLTSTTNIKNIPDHVDTSVNANDSLTKTNDTDGINDEAAVESEDQAQSSNPTLKEILKIDPKIRKIIIHSKNLCLLGIMMVPTLWALLMFVSKLVILFMMRSIGSKKEFRLIQKQI